MVVRVWECEVRDDAARGLLKIFSRDSGLSPGQVRRER